MRISDWSSDVCSSDLCVLLFGIINFGLILSFKQDMTRAAAEGARAGAVAVAGPSEADAEVATDEAVREFGDRFTDGCATDGMKTADGCPGCDARITKARKSGVKGKSGAVRVDLGGRRIMTKKKQLQIE